MRTFSTARGAAALAILLLAGATAAWASGATFAVSGQGIALGEGKEIEENGKEVVRFHGKATVGTPFTLTAQGMVLPRGGKAQPGEPDAGAWSAAGKQFKTLPPAGPADKTKIAIRLEPIAAGTARARFEGKILGYERTYEVVIDVAEKK